MYEYEHLLGKLVRVYTTIPRLKFVGILIKVWQSVEGTALSLVFEDGTIILTHSISIVTLVENTNDTTNS